MSGKKDFVSVSKRVHKQNLAKVFVICKKYILQEVYKEKHPNVNIGNVKLNISVP